jgi:hypothetical protein
MAAAKVPNGPMPAAAPREADWSKLKHSENISTPLKALASVLDALLRVAAAVLVVAV